MPVGAFLIEGDPTCRFSAYFCVVRQGSAALGIFTAGVLAHLFSRRRSDHLFIEPFVLGGLAYVLWLPLQAAFTAADMALRSNGSTQAGDDFLERFLSHWFGGSSPEYLVGSFACAVLYLSLRNWLAGNSTSAIAHSARNRVWDVLAGCLLVAFGALLGAGRYLAIQEQIRLLAGLQEQMPNAIEAKNWLLANTWQIVGWSSVPHVVVGALLLIPSRKHSIHTG